MEFASNLHAAIVEDLSDDDLSISEDDFAADDLEWYIDDSDSNL